MFLLVDGVAEARVSPPDVLVEGDAGAGEASCGWAARLVPGLSVDRGLVVVVQGNVQPQLVAGVPLHGDLGSEGGVQLRVLVVDVVQLVILLGYVFQLLGLGWFSGRAGAIGELDKLFLGDIRVGGDEGGHWVIVCVGAGGPCGGADSRQGRPPAQAHRWERGLQ